MQTMPGITAVASRRGFSAGAVVVLGVGLAVYQLTSLVLGPGSRQLHLSLAIPAVDVDGLSTPGSSGVRPSIGTQAGLAPASFVRVMPAPSQPLSGKAAVPLATATVVSEPGPVIAAPPALPVASPVPATHDGGHRATHKRNADR
jgi:hypothetical protein